MKQVTLESLPAGVEPLLDTVGDDRVVLTRGGRPVAVVFGIGNLDGEDLAYAADPAFWSMIRTRRAEVGRVSLEDVKAKLEADERAEAVAAAGVEAPKER